MPLRRLILSALAAAVLAAAGACAVLTSSADDWRPLSLVGLLFVLAAGSEVMGFETRGLRLSGSFVALVLAMALLGPAPACALAVVSGEAAPAFVEALGSPLGISVEGPADGAWRVRADHHDVLCDALAAVERPPGRLRIEVDPLRI